jgi:DUF4097 and DUF4098 domain-containing protein YvlB
MSAIQRLVIVCCSVLVPTSVAAQTRGWDLIAVAALSQPESDPGTEEWSRVIKMPKGALDVSNIAGDIVVIGGPGDEIRLSAVKRVRVRGRNREGTRAQLDELRIKVLETPGRVVVRTVYPEEHSTHAQVDFKIHVPINVSVAVHTVSGGVRLENIQGETRVESVSGSLVLSETMQLSKAKTVSGSIRIDGSAGDAMSVGTVSGELIAEGIKAKTCDLQTVSGHLALRRAKCDRAQLRSISGEVEFAGPFAAGGRYEFNSHSGDVRVLVGSGAGFQLVANSFSGSLRSDLPLKGARDSQEESFMPNRELRGTVGDGSAYVVVKTFSGSVLISETGSRTPAPKPNRRPSRRERRSDGRDDPPQP